MTTTTTDPAGRDRLYFGQQRALLLVAHEAWASATAWAAELRRRLDHLDELHESVDLEQDGANVQHHFAGEPLPWLQQQLGPSVRAVAVAAERLRFAAADLEQAANETGNLSRLAHIARGHAALVAEAQRVVDSFSPGRDRTQVDWARVDVVVAGIDRLEDRQDAELREELSHELLTHDQKLDDLRAVGLGSLADTVAADPALQRALARMREFVGDARVTADHSHAR